MIDTAQRAALAEAAIKTVQPDELSPDRLIRSDDLIMTPISFKIDGILWREVPKLLIGRPVGLRRVRRPTG